MAFLLSRLPMGGVSSSQRAHSENITPAPDIPWDLVGPARDHLLDRLKKMYWNGVKSELEVIIRTLRSWQQPQYESVVLDDESDDFIHGFDTFIDQVSQDSRAFATLYGTFAAESSFCFGMYIIQLIQVKANGNTSERAILGRDIKKPFSIVY